LTPDLFITLAERNGLIDKLFEKVIDTAISDWWLWTKEGLDISLAINISIENLRSSNFVMRLEKKLADTLFPSEKLILEITESTLIYEFSLVLNILARLRIRRINLSIDDFGTGYSSMIQLRDIPFNELKIDKSFVHEAWEDRVSKEIFNTSMQLAKKLDLKTVAEGVENIKDWDFLVNSECDLAQGHYIGRPMPADLIIPWYKEWLFMYKKKIQKIKFEFNVKFIFSAKN